MFIHTSLFHVFCKCLLWARHCHHIRNIYSSEDRLCVCVCVFICVVVVAGSRFILLSRYWYIQVFQNHLLKRLFILHCIVLISFRKIDCIYIGLLDLKVWKTKFSVLGVLLAAVSLFTCAFFTHPSWDSLGCLFLRHGIFTQFWKFSYLV